MKGLFSRAVKVHASTSDVHERETTHSGRKQTCAVPRRRDAARRGCHRHRRGRGRPASISKALWGDGSRWGVKITYIPQEAPLGLAHAVKISRDFVGDDRFVMFLGDNVIQGGLAPLLRGLLPATITVRLLLTPRAEPPKLCVAQLDNGRIVRLIEKLRSHQQTGARGHLHVRFECL